MEDIILNNSIFKLNSEKDHFALLGEEFSSWRP